jgi:hypothetical protein
LSVAKSQNRIGGIEMNVMNRSAVGVAHGPDLTKDPSRVDHKKASGSWPSNIVLDKPDKRVLDPRATIRPVQPFAGPLQRPAFLFDLGQLLANEVPRLDNARVIILNQLFREC